jgi:hypothetical protein
MYTEPVYPTDEPTPAPTPAADCFSDLVLPNDMWSALPGLQSPGAMSLPSALPESPAVASPANPNL